MVYIKKEAGKEEGYIVINFAGRKGGGAVAAYEMTKALIKLKQKVLPVLPAKIENRKLWEELGCEHIIFFESYEGIWSYIFKSIFFFKIAGKIKKEAQGFRIKAVYIPMAGPWTKKINALFSDIKQIAVCHDPIPHSGKDRITYQACKNTFDSADVVITHSCRFVPYLEKKYTNVRYIPLGPHSIYHQLAGKKIIVYPKNKINFLFFGRIDEYKGLDILLKAYAQIEKKHPDKTTLSVVGNGDISKYSKYINQVCSIRIVNRWIKDEEVESVFLGNNLVTVCPYKDATQSGVVLVSYDYGVPVIASDTGALREQVFDEKTGLLIKKNSVRALVNAMEKFVSSPLLMRKMKKNISKYLLEISWDRSAEKLVQIIDG